MMAARTTWPAVPAGSAGDRVVGGGGRIAAMGQQHVERTFVVRPGRLGGGRGAAWIFVGIFVRQGHGLLLPAPTPRSSFLPFFSLFPFFLSSPSPPS
jgi:hypothetical protein